MQTVTGTMRMSKQKQRSLRPHKNKRLRQDPFLTSARQGGLVHTIGISWAQGPRTTSLSEAVPHRQAASEPDSGSTGRGENFIQWPWGFSVPDLRQKSHSRHRSVSSTRQASDPYVADASIIHGTLGLRSLQPLRLAAGYTKCTTQKVNEGAKQSLKNTPDHRITPPASLAAHPISTFSKFRPLKQP